MIERRNKGEAYQWPADHEWVAPNVSPALIRFKESWENFVESVLKEWKTLNVVSALLMTAILTILQIIGESTTAVIRTSAFLSLICALMSLLYGCVYILRFGTMRSMYRASKWAEDAHLATSFLWNVWVLLAMPAVWIAWSMLFFCICIIGLVWDQPFSPTSSSPAVPTVSTQTSRVLAVSSSGTDHGALAPRIVISFTFVLGLVYFILVVRTFRRWGDPRISQDVREVMETGKWTTQSPSLGNGAPASPQPIPESRFDGDEKKQTIGRERRTRSVDSVSIASKTPTNGDGGTIS
ncbi:hypothetical protein JB92DRAFT_2729700 [Gautieria morchelliformis]|nr:hypothetical protein JB92DRAFT_2729700 [Gautieria morchelliformis]